MEPNSDTNQSMFEALGPPILSIGSTPKVSSREKELFLYWRASSAARRGPDRLEGYDDLHMIALHTDWPLLKRRSAEALV